MLSATEMLSGAGLTHELEVPAELIGGDADISADSRVVLRPLTVRDLQRVDKAAGDEESLSAALMIQLAMVEPALTFDEVSRLPAGLARFLVEQISSLSGIDVPRDALGELVQAPLARACFVLAKEFGWTPEEVSGMTIGQILLYLEMSHAGGSNA